MFSKPKISDTAPHSDTAKGATAPAKPELGGFLHNDPHHRAVASAVDFRKRSGRPLGVCVC